jgi:DNA-binding response OmpR family regulator
LVDILIADDHRFIRDMVRITLSTQGWTIAEAATTADALELTRRDPPKAILLDVIFSEEKGRNGLDVCREIKGDPLTKGIPVIMLTARDSEAERKEGLAAGASHYLVKPFGPIDLIRTLRGLLGDPPAVETLGQYLIDEKILTHDQLGKALELQRSLEAKGQQRRLGEVLTLMHAVTPEQLEKALEHQKRHARG